MKKQVNRLIVLLKQKKIALPQGATKYDNGHERWHALKAGLPQPIAYLIYFGASNHMVSSKKYFSTLTLSKGPNIPMGDDSQIPAKGRGSVKVEHGEFKNVLYVPSLATNLLSVYQMTRTSSPKQVLFGPD